MHSPNYLKFPQPKFIFTMPIQLLLFGTEKKSFATSKPQNTFPKTNRTPYESGKIGEEILNKIFGPFGAVGQLIFFLTYYQMKGKTLGSSDSGIAGRRVYTFG